MCDCYCNLYACSPYKRGKTGQYRIYYQFLAFPTLFSRHLGWEGEEHFRSAGIKQINSALDSYLFSEISSASLFL